MQDTMYTLKVKGNRRNTLAFHQLDSRDELDELLTVYRVLGYKPEALEVEERQEEKAA